MILLLSLGGKVYSRVLEKIIQLIVDWFWNTGTTLYHHQGFTEVYPISPHVFQRLEKSIIQPCPLWQTVGGALQVWG